jgi:hypothetical protein
LGRGIDGNRWCSLKPGPSPAPAAPVHESWPSKDRQRQETRVQPRHGRTARQQSRALFCSLPFPLQDILRAHRTGARRQGPEHRLQPWPTGTDPPGSGHLHQTTHARAVTAVSTTRSSASCPCKSGTPVPAGRGPPHPRPPRGPVPYRRTRRPPGDTAPGTNQDQSRDLTHVDTASTSGRKRDDTPQASQRNDRSAR